MNYHQGTFDFLFKRRRQYRLTFGNLAAQDVLIDLARFCRATKTTAHTDALTAARLEGRREVFLRIQEHLGLSTEQLYALYGGPAVQNLTGEQTNG